MISSISFRSGINKYPKYSLLCNGILLHPKNSIQTGSGYSFGSAFMPLKILKQFEKKNDPKWPCERKRVVGVQQKGAWLEN
jgi:hypothetical protein